MFVGQNPGRRCHHRGHTTDRGSLREQRSPRPCATSNLSIVHFPVGPMASRAPEPAISWGGLLESADQGKLWVSTLFSPKARFLPIITLAQKAIWDIKGLYKCRATARLTSCRPEPSGLIGVGPIPKLLATGTTGEAARYATTPTVSRALPIHHSRSDGMPARHG